MSFLSKLFAKKPGGTFLGNITRSLGVNPTAAPPMEGSVLANTGTSPVGNQSTSTVGQGTFLDSIKTGAVRVVDGIGNVLNNGVKTTVGVDNKVWMMLGLLAMVLIFFRKKIFR